MGSAHDTAVTQNNRILSDDLASVVRAVGIGRRLDVILGASPAAWWRSRIAPV